MRLWSLHPCYLDTKGLVALWRETLLAKHVLEGRTTGYRNHPQLQRFKEAEHPLDCINQYLAIVYEEATKRNYRFDRSKINLKYKTSLIPVNSGQVAYEVRHLLSKLKQRDPARHAAVSKLKKLRPHPLFKVCKGDVESWETVPG